LESLPPSPSLPLCLAHLLSHCVSHCVSHCSRWARSREATGGPRAAWTCRTPTWTRRRAAARCAACTTPSCRYGVRETTMGEKVREGLQPGHAAGPHPSKQHLFASHAGGGRPAAGRELERRAAAQRRRGAARVAGRRRRGRGEGVPPPNARLLQPHGRGDRGQVREREREREAFHHQMRDCCSLMGVGIGDR
jgi:hypothetical protein